MPDLKIGGSCKRASACRPSNALIVARIYFGTEVFSPADRSLAAVLGARLAHRSP